MNLINDVMQYLEQKMILKERTIKLGKAFQQMAYWYKVTGKLFYYSYQSEGFPFLTNPQIGTVLWGARNGWFIYTPIMLFSMTWKYCNTTPKQQFRINP